MARRERRYFTRGAPLFKCHVCRRLTRNPDHSGTMLCAQCYEIAGLDNHVNDNSVVGDELAKIVAECDGYLAEIGAKGGNVERVKNLNGFIWQKGDKQ
jgi:hypothetical protein